MDVLSGRGSLDGQDDLDAPDGVVETLEVQHTGAARVPPIEDGGEVLLRGLHSEAQHRRLELLLVDRPIAILITVPEELNRLQIGLLERCLELMGDLPGSLLDALRLRRGLVRRRGRFRLDPFVRSAHGRRRSRRCVCGRGGRRGCSGREGRMLKQ